MAYTALRTWVTGETVTAALMNAQIRDNQKYHGVLVGRVTSLFSIPDDTNTAIEWNQEDFDTNAFHDTSTNNERLTVPSGSGGTYQVTGQLRMVGHTSGGTLRIVEIRLNGTTRIGQFTVPVLTDSSSVNISLQTSITVALVATDYVELMGHQDSGGSQVATQLGTSQSFFGMTLLGGA